MSGLLDTASFFRSPFAGSLVVALVCSFLGVFVVGRRMVLVGVALPQVAAAGIAASFLAETVSWTAAGTALAFTRDHSSMAVLASFLGLAALVRRPGRRTLPAEVAAGAAFCIAGAAAVLCVQASAAGMDELRHLVEGEILAIHDRSLPSLVAVLGGVLLVDLVLVRRLLATAFDPEMAAVLGVRTRLHDALFLAGLALVVARAVHAAGTLFVFAYLLLPACAGLVLARRPWAVLATSCAVGVTGAAAGFLVAADTRVDWPVGPTATATVFVLFVGAAGVGWVRRRVIPAPA